MDRSLRPDCLDVNATSDDAPKQFKHWFATFNHYLGALPQDGLNKRAVLFNFVSADVFEYICDCSTFDEATAKLKQLYLKPVNEIYARHLLATRRQRSDESLDEYLQVLRSLSKDCNFKNVDANTYADEAIRDSFIAGILSNSIRQRLLENKVLDLGDIFDQARSLDIAFRNSESYVQQPAYVNSISSPPSATIVEAGTSDQQICASSEASSAKRCWNCGNARHSKAVCPARNAVCHNCSKTGHFAKCCKSKSQSGFSASISHPTLAMVAPSDQVIGGLKKATISVVINDAELKALIDSGSSGSFINPSVVSMLSLPLQKSNLQVSMASANMHAAVNSCVMVDIDVNGKVYRRQKLFVMDQLCCDVILGLDFQGQHKSVVFEYGGEADPISICGLATVNVSPPRIFNLTEDCKPIATKSRRFGAVDKAFIDSEISRLLSEGIIEPSHSPWRSQVVVTKESDSHKRRLVIDYSQTVNQFTVLDAFPVPNMDEFVEDIAKYRVFSTIDLKSAYHQIPLHSDDKPFTAFEACGRLYQFTRMPFGVTNGVSGFQRIMSDLISDENLTGTFAYLDNVIIGGIDQVEHDENLEKFMTAARKFNITYNDSKSIFSTTELKTMGFIIGPNGQVRPDPERLRPLREMPCPHDKKSLKRVTGMFSYYSKWIRSFSDKILPLARAEKFPLDSDAELAFNNLKQEVESAVLYSVDNSSELQLETDASDFAFQAC